MTAKELLISQHVSKISCNSRSALIDTKHNTWLSTYAQPLLFSSDVTAKSSVLISTVGLRTSGITQEHWRSNDRIIVHQGYHPAGRLRQYANWLTQHSRNYRLNTMLISLKTATRVVDSFDWERCLCLSHKNGNIYSGPREARKVERTGTRASAYPDVTGERSWAR